jgi:quinol monooxygenase YgiN
MVKVALFVRLEAKPGKENDVRSFLASGLSLVREEPATTTWYAMQMGPSTFGIFDTFPDESGRKIHLAGKVAKALAEKAGDLFAKPPEIMKVDIIAAKIPPARGQLENQPSAAV